MKRLWALVFFTVLLVGVLGVFNTSKVHAQSIDRQTETGNIINKRGSYDYYIGVITGLHNAALDAFRANASRDTTTISLKAQQDYTTVAQRNFDAYLAAFNAEKARSTSTVDAQIKGIQAWIASRDLGSNLQITRSYNVSSPYRSAYEQYGRKVQDAANAAEQIKRGIIDAGSEEAAVQTSTSTITNAAAGNRNVTGTVMDSSPNACSLLNGNLVGCIDQLFGWIIKHTFLRIAEFFLYLTANLLNLAIKLSIFDFAKIASDGLYPTWVVIRQIISLFVVFAGLYLGFLYIIGKEETFQKYVGWLILFALFVNFSYPFTRMLVDVSNIVSLNVYSAALGPEVLTAGSGSQGAGDILTAKLNIADMKNNIGTPEGTDPKATSSTAGSLAGVIFFLYAAYIFFMATAIIVVRAAVLVFLIVASPLLLIDSVVPKLGDLAVKMREMFFKQLVVAPVFMIMLALTLKFMDVFKVAGASGGVGLYFNMFIMLIMLHIMLRVTKEVAGSAGQAATNFMGKVGGFGLGVASGGVGVLARGSIGAAAARLRDSDRLKNMQDSRIGRGLYGLTNSLAQSSFDTRNIGMVNRGMASAGMGMGAGSKMTYDRNFKQKEAEIRTRSSYIKDANVRERYLDQQTKTVGSVAQRGFLKAVGLKGDNKRSDAQIIRDKILSNRDDLWKRYSAFKDEDKKRDFLDAQSKDVQDYINAKEATLLSQTPDGAAPAPTEPIEGAATSSTAATQAVASGGIDTSYVDMAEGRSPMGQKVVEAVNAIPREELPKASERRTLENPNQNKEETISEQDIHKKSFEEIAADAAKKRADRLKEAQQAIDRGEGVVAQAASASSSSSSGGSSATASSEDTATA